MSKLNIETVRDCRSGVLAAPPVKLDSRGTTILLIEFNMIYLNGNVINFACVADRKWLLVSV